MFTVVVQPAGAPPGIPAPESFDDPGTRALTVAIHLNVGPDSEVAVAAAVAILPELAPLLRRADAGP